MKFESAYFELAAGTSQQLPASDMPEIVFAGHSNVGKSSLITEREKALGGAYRGLL